MALTRLVPEPAVSRLLDLWRKGGLAERVDLGEITELEMADGTKVCRATTWPSMPLSAGQAGPGAAA